MNCRNDSDGSEKCRVAGSSKCSPIASRSPWRFCAHAVKADQNSGRQDAEQPEEFFGQVSGCKVQGRGAALFLVSFRWSAKIRAGEGGGPPGFPAGPGRPLWPGLRTQASPCSRSMNCRNDRRVGKIHGEWLIDVQPDRLNAVKAENSGRMPSSQRSSLVRYLDAKFGRFPPGLGAHCGRDCNSGRPGPRRGAVLRVLVPSAAKAIRGGRTSRRAG